jgi:hypothetical protein
MTMCLATCIVSGKHRRHMKQQRHECVEAVGEGGPVRGGRLSGGGEF